MPEKNNDQGKLGGVERAAIFLLSLGEESASEVLKYIGPKEVHKISTAMANMGKISREQVNEILYEFNEIVSNETALGVGSKDYLRNVLVKALGEDRAGSTDSRHQSYAGYTVLAN